MFTVFMLFTTYTVFLVTEFIMNWYRVETIIPCDLTTTREGVQFILVRVINWCKLEHWIQLLHNYSYVESRAWKGNMKFVIRTQKTNKSIAISLAVITSLLNKYHVGFVCPKHIFIMRLFILCYVPKLKSKFWSVGQCLFVADH